MLPKDLLNALEAWAEEDDDNRAVIAVAAENKGNKTNGSLIFNGDERNLASIFEELFKDKDIAYVALNEYRKAERRRQNENNDKQHNDFKA